MIRIAICDDSTLFQESLRTEIRSILNRYAIEAVIHIFDQGEAIPEQAFSSFDVFFLDIDFAEKSYTGIDIARWVRKHQQNAVIVFVTNFIEYAPEGYEVQAFRYLLKNEIREKLEPCLIQIMQKLQTDQETMQINIAGEIVTLPLIDILYIESQGHLAVVHVLKQKGKTPKTYSFYSSLSRVEQQLSTKGFLRIHKSYLVNMRRLKKYRCTEAELDNGEILKVSEKNYAEQKKQYLLWKARL